MFEIIALTKKMEQLETERKKAIEKLNKVLNNEIEKLKKENNKLKEENNTLKTNIIALEQKLKQSKILFQPNG